MNYISYIKWSVVCKKQKEGSLDGRFTSVGVGRRGITCKKTGKKEGAQVMQGFESQEISYLISMMIPMLWGWVTRKLVVPPTVIEKSGNGEHLRGRNNSHPGICLIFDTWR